MMHLFTSIMEFDEGRRMGLHRSWDRGCYGEWRKWESKVWLGVVIWGWGRCQRWWHDDNEGGGARDAWLGSFAKCGLAGVEKEKENEAYSMREPWENESVFSSVGYFLVGMMEMEVCTMLRKNENVDDGWNGSLWIRFKVRKMEMRSGGGRRRSMWKPNLEIPCKTPNLECLFECLRECIFWNIFPNLEIFSEMHLFSRVKVERNNSHIEGFYRPVTTNMVVRVTTTTNLITSKSTLAPPS